MKTYRIFFVDCSGRRWSTYLEASDRQAAIFAFGEQDLYSNKFKILSCRVFRGVS